MSEGNRKTGRFQAATVLGVTNQHSAVMARSDNTNSRLITVDNVKIGKLFVLLKCFEALHSALSPEV